MKTMKNVCVYGAASNFVSTYFKNAVYTLGHKLAKHGYGLVYGGGGCGLMGSVAHGALDAGGEVTGIIPEFMHEFEEVNILGKTHYVKTMSERKDEMERLADAFVVVPGGIGTMDEFFQVVTQNYLRRYNKKVILLNIDGFYDNLIRFLKDMVKQKCLKEETFQLVHVANSVEEAIEMLP